MEEKSWRSNHLEGVAEGIWRQRQPGGTKEVFRRHPGGIQEASRRSSGRPQEAPRMLPGLARGAQRQPEGNQRQQGGSQGTVVFDAKCAKTIMLYSKNCASNHFRVHGSDVTFTKSAAFAQK